MSRARKFETTGTPVRSARMAGSPICSVWTPPSWQMVWPWQPISSMGP
jgi:hypothetical protein